MKVQEEEESMKGGWGGCLRKDAKTRCQLWRGFSTAAKKSQEESATTTTTTEATMAATGKQSNKNKESTRMRHCLCLSVCVCVCARESVLSLSEKGGGLGRRRHKKCHLRILCANDKHFTSAIKISQREREKESVRSDTHTHHHCSTHR